MIPRIVEVEEPVFFVIGVLLAPLAMGVGLVGSLVFFIKGLSRKQLTEIDQPGDERVQT